MSKWYGIVMLILWRCAPAPAPSVLSDVGTPLPVSASPSTSPLLSPLPSTPPIFAGATPLATPTVTGEFFGAAVGSTELKNLVKACVQKGFFFDRSATASQCTALPKAQVPCGLPQIKTVLPVQYSSELDSLLATTLIGFSLDQCLDCPSLGVPQCANQQGRTGTKLFFVKEDVTGIAIKTIVVPKS